MRLVTTFGHWPFSVNGSSPKLFAPSDVVCILLILFMCTDCIIGKTDGVVDSSIDAGEEYGDDSNDEHKSRWFMSFNVL